MPPSGRVASYYAALGDAGTDQRAGGVDSGVVVAGGVVASVGFGLPAAGGVVASGAGVGVEGVALGAGVGAVVASGVTGSASCFLQPVTAAAVRINAKANLAGTFSCFMVTTLV